MPMGEIVFLAGALSSGIALSVWARWSRWQFERSDSGGAVEADPRQGTLPFPNRPHRIDVAHAVAFPQEIHTSERRLLWKVALVTAARRRRSCWASFSPSCTGCEQRVIAVVTLESGRLP